ADNGRRRGLPPLAGAAALRELAGRAARVTAARSASFAAAHRVSDGIHRHAADMRTTPLPAGTARLADHDLDAVRVAQLANRRPALAGNPPDFAGRERDLGPIPFAGVHDGRHAGAAAELPAASRLHFDIVHRGARRNPLEREAVADFRFGVGAAGDLLAG